MDPWQPDAAWIANRPLREIPAEVVNEFVNELPSGIIGDPEDVRYLTPRLLDLAFRDELGTVLDAPVLIALALSRARWTEWSSREQAAIRAFLAEYLEWSISGRRSSTFEALVTALAILFDDLEPWLAQIRSHQDVQGVFALLWLAHGEGHRLLQGNRCARPFLESREAQGEQLLAWLRDSRSFAQVNTVKNAVGLVAPDGEDLHWLFEQVTHWLQVCAAETRPHFRDGGDDGRGR